MVREKKIKIKKGEGLPGISIEGEEKFSVSIGARLGREEREDVEKFAAGKTAPKDISGEAEDIGVYLGLLRQATLRRETARRGGRVVTVLSCNPAPSPKRADELALAMRKGLGCGSHVEGEKLVLQGDLRERAEAWLKKRGVKKVVIGN